MKKVFLFFVVLIAIGPFAHARSSALISGLQAQPLPIEAENIHLKGYRFLNKKGQPNTGRPLLFTHGLVSNYHEFEHMIAEQMALGFDCYAFNFRGHGNEEEKSTVIEYHEGDYSFQKMAEVDFPTMIKTVRQSSGQKVTVIGHSMGGMVPRASIALGLIDPNDLEAMVLLGSPPHLRTKPGGLVSVMEKRLLKRIFSGSGQDPISILDALHELEETMDLIHLINPAYWLTKLGLETHWEILNDVIYMLGIHDTHWSARSRTKFVPKDIMRSFANFQDSYPYEDMKISAPTLYIMGEKDALVKANDIIEAAKSQSSEAGYWLMTLKGVGHVSLVVPGVLKKYQESLQKFLEKPESIGPANETHLVSKCSGLLIGI